MRGLKAEYNNRPVIETNLMIPVEKALKIILKEVHLKKTEVINIMFSLDRVLAEDIVSSSDIPPFERSAMDGYAVRSEDIKKAGLKNPVVLKVTADLPAGKFFKGTVKKGEAVRIMTGAPMPRGANTVVMVEDTESVSDSSVSVFKKVVKRTNVSNRGEDIKKGEVVLRKGKVIRPAEVGMLSSLGISEVKVYSRPVVSVIATGDELVNINEKLGKGKIRNSNSYSLSSQVIKAGGIPNIIGIARDNRKDLVEKIKKSRDSDILILSGGVSVGIYDLVKKVLLEIGVKSLFWKINIKPGKPVFFGRKGRQLVFGLPGYPVSSMLTFDLFVRPCILKMYGNKDTYRNIVNAKLQSKIKRKPGRREYIRAKIKLIDGDYYVNPTGPQGSGILKSLVLADGLIIVPEEVSCMPKGSTVKVILLD